jgi:hypothetical protein
MTVYTIGARDHWSLCIQAALGEAKDGDTIQVPHRDAEEFAMLLHRAQCPDKEIYIEVEGKTTP